MKSSGLTGMDNIPVPLLLVYYLSVTRRETDEKGAFESVNSIPVDHTIQIHYVQS